MRKLACLVGVSVFALAAALRSDPASGQAQLNPPTQGPSTAAKPGIEEVVVSARKRTERLIDVPVAATVLSGKTLGKSGLTMLAAISQQVPQLIIAETGVQTGGSISLRGIGASNFNPTSDQLVSINVDGVQVSQGQIIRLGQYDLGSLEVLKGPQTLFFGKNSPAGIISMNTADPTPRAEAQLRTGYEFESKLRFVEGYVSGPITDGLEARLFGHHGDADGYFKNDINAASGLAPNVRTGPDVTDDFGRLSFTYNPPDSNFSARFKASYSSFSNDSGVFSYQQTSSCALGVPQEFGSPAPFSSASDCQLDQYYVQPKVGPAFTAIDPKSFGNGQPFLRDTQALVSMELNYDFSQWARLTSVTGYYGAHEDELDPFLSAPVPLLVSRSDLHNLQFTEELRLASNTPGPLNYLVGGFFQSSKLMDYVPVAFGIPLAPGLPVPFEEPIDNIGVDTKAYSFFGQIRYKFLDNLELAAGARYSHEDKSIIGTVGGGSLDLPQFSDPALTENPTQSFHNISPDVTLTYKPTGNLTLYAAYRQGFVSGGYNTAAGQFLSPILVALATGTPIVKQDLAYNQTTNAGEEVGVKGYLLDRQVRFDFSAYDYKYTNLQVPQQDPTGISLTVKNAAAATSRGVELNTFIEPAAVPGLQLRDGLAYNEGSYDEFIGGCYVGQTIAEGCNLIRSPSGAFTSQNQSGQQLLRAPKWVFNTGFTYDHRFTDNLSGLFSFDTSYQSSYPTELENDPVTRQRGFWQLGASIGVRGRHDSWALDLIGRNLTNELAKTVTFASPFQGAGTGTTSGIRSDYSSVPVPPISVLLQLTLRSSLFFNR